MTTPRVTEMPLDLTPVEADPFIAAPAPASASRRRRDVRDVRARHTEMIRSEMYTRFDRSVRLARARAARPDGAHGVQSGVQTERD